MLRFYHSPTLSRVLLHRRFSSAATAIATDPALDSVSEPLFSYLEGFPKPDPKYAETILAIPRSTSGKTICAKERKVGRVPSILFEQEDGQHGGNKRLISVRTNQIVKLVKNLGRSFFLSRLFDLEVLSDFESGDIVEKVRVLPRQLDNSHFELAPFMFVQIHLHAGTDAPLNVTFIRAPSHAVLKVDVPLVFRGEDVCPGLRKGSYLNTIKRTVKYLCPADIIPPYIDVDLSELDVGQKLVMGDLKVHPALKLVKSKDEPVCKIAGARVSDQQKKSK
ncbi:50S ribosomal protein L25 [Cucumis melo var. makuwa]|uniref:50S ribosomal protein L25 n=1 Tax=Cucumis melo var. makuwa TaxID=1194695 RepID=A0A5A7UD34_CUCMM|nr:50S ribosomal protein L25 [Cucumis melo var. makuwa]